MADCEAMLEICLRFTDEAPEGYVVREPYVPLVPQGWNGLLALAEAQNLADPEDDYVKRLDDLSPKERMQRLKPTYPVGIEPWDDGSMKLMLKSMIPSIGLSRVAVSNAVPWSFRTEGRSNLSPPDKAQVKAAEFWREMLNALAPSLSLVVAFGNVAEYVIQEAGWTGHFVKLRLPSPSARYRLANMFDTNDLLTRFPEVAFAWANLPKPDPSLETLALGQVLFACHAVSLRRLLPDGRV